MANVRLIVDGAELAAVLRSPDGPVVRNLMVRAQRVIDAAKPAAPFRTGCLRDNIRKRYEVSDLGVAVRIVSSTKECSPTRTEYAAYVHEGTAPHDIPNAFGYGPQFGIGGRFGGKFHPGTKATKYLSRFLHLAVADV